MKLRTFLMAGLVTLSLVLPASALTLSVDGRDRTAEAKTTAIQNTTYVSLRSVATMLDPTAQVDWKDGKAWVTTDKLTLTARPGDEYIQVNGRYNIYGQWREGDQWLYHGRDPAICLCDGR